MIPPKIPEKEETSKKEISSENTTFRKKTTHLGHGYSQVIKKSQIKVILDPLQDLNAVYKPHKELFFEDEKDKKQNVLQASTEILASTMENNLQIKSDDFMEMQKIQTSEYLSEIGIEDEMRKIKLHKESNREDANRRFEKLNVENPINKVEICHF